MTATHCRQGHPWDEANTWTSPTSGQRHCRACRRNRNGPGFLAPDALLALKADRTDQAFARDLGVNRRQVWRWKTGQSRIPRATADRYANAVGRHPLELWPELAGA